MSLDRGQCVELGEQIARLSDGTITPEEFGRLETVLAGDPKAREFYRDTMALDAELGWSFGGAALRKVPKRWAPQGRRKGWMIAASVAAAAALYLILAPLRSRPDSKPEPVSVVRPDESPVARVVESDGVLERISPSGESVALKAGDSILKGQTVSTGGGGSSATVEFPDKTRLELSPETMARLVSGPEEAKRIIFTSGVLRVDAAPQPEGRPLVLSTAQAEIVVRGTRFLVSSAAPEVTRVDMESGTLQIVRPSDGRSFEISAGSYAVIESGREPMVVRPAPRDISQPQRTLGFGGARSIGFLPDGKGLLAASSRMVMTWEEGGNSPRKFGVRDRKGESGFGVVSQDGSTIALWSREGELILWDVAGKKERFAFGLKGKDNQILAISPNGDRVAVVDSDTPRQGVIRIMSALDGTLLHTLATESVAVRSLAWSPDGGTLAAGAAFKGKKEHKIILYDASSATLRTTLVGHARAIQALAFSSDGRRLASSGQDGVIHLWNRDTLVLERSLEGHQRQIGALLFSPDGKRLAGGSGEGETWVWDSATGDVSAILKVGRHCVWGLAFSPDGKSLATVGCNLPVMVWSLP
jgi:WD40 repeat protein